MYRMIVFDLDGTLLDRDKNIPEANLRALYRAAEKGIEIVPATGRICPSIPQALLELPFLHYGIGVNGGCIYDYRTNTILDRQEIPLDLVFPLIDHAHELGVAYDCYQDNCGYASREHYENAGNFILDPGIVKLFYSNRKPVDCLEDFLRQRNLPIQKLQFYFLDMDQRAYELQHLPEQYPELSITTSIPGNIEFNLASANKGDALRRLCSLLHIAPEETIAFGDDINDISMLQTAGMGVAMANAKPEVKAVANMITISNNEGGVAYALDRLIG